VYFLIKERPPNPGLRDLPISVPLISDWQDLATFISAISSLAQKGIVEILYLGPNLQILLLFGTTVNISTARLTPFPYHDERRVLLRRQHLTVQASPEVLTAMYIHANVWSPSEISRAYVYNFWEIPSSN
jgi:hypothetical protein